MTFVKGTPKPANSGRKKGVGNKFSTKLVLDIVETLKAKGHDPAAFHIKVLAHAWNNYLKSVKHRRGFGGSTNLDIAMRANAELMRYCYPTRKAIEHTGKDGEQLFKSMADMALAYAKSKK